MLMHHLWGFPDRRPIGKYELTSPLLPFTVNDRNVFLAVGQFGKICVVLFIFLAGLGLYRQYASSNFSLWNKIKRFYLSYWKVFVIMIPVAFLFFAHQEQLTAPDIAFFNKYSEFDLNTFILNLFGLSTSYNAEWWFVFAYVASCIFGELYILSTRRCHNVYVELFFVACLNTLFYRIIPMFINLPAFAGIEKSVIYRLYFKQPCMTAFFSGIVAAKYNILENMISRMNRLALPQRILLCFAGLVSAFYIRTFNGGQIYDFLTAPFLVVMFLGLIKLEKHIIYGALVFLGKHSENMWLIHSFYCYYFSLAVRIVYKSGNFLISFIVLVIMTLISSVCINLFYDWIRKLSGMRLRAHGLSRSA